MCYDRSRKKWSVNTGDCLIEVNSYVMFYDRTRNRWPFNTGDCLIEVNSWVCFIVLCKGFNLDISVSNLR